MRHLLSLDELSRDDIEAILQLAVDLKAQFRQGVRTPHLAGRAMGLLFEKPSLRTRVSFEAAMGQLGGTSLFLGADVGFGQRESLADFAQVLTSYLDVLVCRTNSHARLAELVSHAGCSVINGLTDLAHPCQALADLLTLRELHGTLKGLKLAYVGDANNVAHSLAEGCAKLGVTFAIAAPEGYAFAPQFVDRLRRNSPQSTILETHDAGEAVRDAQAVYTDVWTSMGQESERAQRTAAFTPYQVNAPLMAQAGPGAWFLHCMPARRGEEVTDDVIDGPQSAVLQQAENRMHLQKGLLVWLLVLQN